MLKMSPVKMNRPLRNNRPAQNKTSWMYGEMLKISIRKTIADIKSIAPRTFTSITFADLMGLLRFRLLIVLVVV